MSASQSYGVLRIVHMRPPATATKSREKDLVSKLPEERLVHLLTRKETTIGRALSSDLILLDPTVSRLHARLVLDERGWRIYNVAGQNTLYVNECQVCSGEDTSVQPQDFLILGNTELQLIAPRRHTAPSLLSPSEGRMRVQEWQAEEERLFRAGATLQSVLAQRIKWRTSLIIGGAGILVMLLSALVILILNNLLGVSALVQSDPLNLLAIITIPIIPALGITILVNVMDRFEREPWFLRLAAFLWGAIIAIPPTFLVEQYVDSLRPLILGPHPDDAIHALFAGLNAGITEETVKGLGLLLLFIVLRNEFDNVTDGIVYGALIGAGFAMVENFSYFSTHPKSLLVLLIGRVVLGWLSHSTFTACFGAALGYIRHTRVRWQHILVPLLGYGIAVGLHSVFDFVNFFASSLVVNNPTNATVLTDALIVSVGNYIPPFIAQMVILYCLVKSLAHEASILREFLADEVSDGLVTVDEYTLLQHTVLRKKIERRIVLQASWQQWRQIRALYQAEIELAFHKWHESVEGEKSGYRQAANVYRLRIQQLRREILEAEVIYGRENVNGRRILWKYWPVRGKIK